MNNFYELFTVEGDTDLYHVFRFAGRNESFDNLPTHLARKLDSTFDFTDYSSTSDEYSVTDWSTAILITVVLDVLNELRNEFDADGKITDSILDSNRISNGRTIAPLTLNYFSREPFIYVFKNISEEECLQLLLIDSSCILNTYKNSQAKDAKILRDCVWNLLWALGERASFYGHCSDAELKENGIEDGDIQKHHRENVRKNLSSYVGNSKESWIVENGLNSVRRYEEGFSISEAELREILELIILIKTETSEIFKKRFL